MAFKTIYLFILVFNLLAFSCSNDSKDTVETTTNEEESQQDGGNENDDDSDMDSSDISPSELTIRILPMGDSRVEGNRPEHESYRFELWKLLIDNEIQFDFVGTKTDRADYPEHLGNRFDADHEGTGGATSISLLDKMDVIVSEIDADFILLGIGGNDLDDGHSISNTIENINAIIDGLQADNPNCTILLEQIAPATTGYMTDERIAILNEFNSQILEVSEIQSNENSKVIAVKMFQDWKDDYLADNVHYNVEGAKVIAQHYYRTIDSLLRPQ